MPDILLLDARLAARFRNLPIPVLVITGEHDPIVPRAQAQWLAHNLPQADLSIFGDTGHAPMIEMADDCLHLVLTWLQEHPA